MRRKASLIRFDNIIITIAIAVSVIRLGDLQFALEQSDTSSKLAGGLERCCLA